MAENVHFHLVLFWGVWLWISFVLFFSRPCDASMMMQNSFGKPYGVFTFLLVKGVAGDGEQHRAYWLWASLAAQKEIGC